MSRPGMLIVNVARCIGCKRCMIECAVAHSQSGDLARAMAESPASPSRVVVKPLGEFSAPFQCRHCDDPPCVPACPTGSLAKNPDDGVVSFNADTCMGAAACVKKCPFLGIRVVDEGGKAVKCDLCIDRIAQGRIPACAEACPTGAIVYIPYDELTDEQRAMRSGRPGAALVMRTGVRYVVNPDECIACRKCAMVCPADAIEGAKKTPHKIIQERCVTCGACFINCPVDAIHAFAPDAELPPWANDTTPVGSASDPAPATPADDPAPATPAAEPEVEQSTPGQAAEPTPSARPKGNSPRHLRRQERRQRRRAKKAKGNDRPT